MKRAVLLGAIALLTCIRPLAAGPSPADNLPPHITRLTWLGERPDWRHDGQRFVFVSKVFGEVYEYDIPTGRIYPLSDHFTHYGFTRAQYLPNGDLLLVGPSKPFDQKDAQARRAARKDHGQMYVLDRRLNAPPVSLGVECDEGPAVSRTRFKVAWTQGEQDEIWLGDIVYDDGKPRLTQKRKVMENASLGQPVNIIETQNFVPPDDRAITVTAYQLGGTANTETFVLDLESGRLTNVSRSPDHYDEAEGIFPDGRHTLVEHHAHEGRNWGLSDMHKLALDGSGKLERLTHFTKLPGYKATQGVISDDGRFMLFQIGRSGEEAGQGHGVFLYDFAKAAQSATPIWQRHAFELPQGIWGVEAIDADSDGKLDLMALGDRSVWAILSGRGKPRLLADLPGGRAIHAVALDCDGDGDRDLAIGRSASDFIRYRAMKQEGKAAKEPQGHDFTVAWLENTVNVAKPWPLHVLDRELHGVHGVWVGDVNGDGAADLLADSFAGPHYESSLAWFRAPTSKADAAGKPMPRHIITQGGATGRPHYMDFADINGDGRGDVLLGASSEGTFTWWQQPVSLAQLWQRHLIADEPGATHPRAADVNGDGRLDVIASAGHGVGVMYFAGPSWRKHLIDGDIRDVHAFDAADIDGDGDIDAAGCSFSQKIVRWWENLGDGRFKAHDIDTQHGQEAYDLKIVDLDGDGRKDILLAGRRSNNVVWYRNGG